MNLEVKIWYRIWSKDDPQWGRGGAHAFLRRLQVTLSKETPPIPLATMFSAQTKGNTKNYFLSKGPPGKMQPQFAFTALKLRQNTWWWCFIKNPKEFLDIMSLLKVSYISLKINIKKLHRHSNIGLSHGPRTHIFRTQHSQHSPPISIRWKNKGLSPLLLQPLGLGVYPHIMAQGILTLNNSQHIKRGENLSLLNCFVE